MMYCWAHKQLWPLSSALYLEVTNRSLYAGCPVCCAHGQRVSHIVWGSLAPLPGDMQTMTVASGMATVGEGLTR